MNGSLIGSAVVIANSFKMMGLSCSSGPTHGFLKGILMVPFMLQNTTSFLLGYFAVGSLYSTVVVFFQYILMTIATSGDPKAVKLYTDGIAYKVFVFLYGILLLFSVLVSLAVPIDRSMGYWKFVGTALGALFVSTLVGTIWLTSQVGFTTEEIIVNPRNGKVTYTGIYYTNWLVLATVVVLSVYIVPFVLRPLDFLRNFFKYTGGLVCYLLMLPMFMNVF